MEQWGLRPRFFVFHTNPPMIEIDALRDYSDGLLVGDQFEDYCLNWVAGGGRLASQVLDQRCEREPGTDR